MKYMDEKFKNISTSVHFPKDGLAKIFWLCKNIQPLEFVAQGTEQCASQSFDSDNNLMFLNTYADGCQI